MKRALHLTHEILFLLARAMLSATFIISAVRHLTHWSAALDEMAGDGMPRSSILLLGSVAFRLFGGLSVLLGFRARVGAGLLVAFIVPAALLAHDFWAMPSARQTHETIEFLNNMAIAAGAMLVLLNGPGPLTLDSALNHGEMFSELSPVSTSEPL
jgi:putative oxidoreductase